MLLTKITPLQTALFTVFLMTDPDEIQATKPTRRQKQSWQLPLPERQRHMDER